MTLGCMCHTLIKAAQPHTAIHDNKSARCVATGVARVVHADPRGRHVDDLAQSNMSDDMRLRRAGAKILRILAVPYDYGITRPDQQRP